MNRDIPNHSDVFEGIDNVPAAWQWGGDWLGWLALAAVAAAAMVSFWDRTARFGWPVLYGAGLIAVGMALDARGLLPRVYLWTAGHELAGFCAGGHDEG